MKRSNPKRSVPHMTPSELRGAVGGKEGDGREDEDLPEAHVGNSGHGRDRDGDDFGEMRSGAWGGLEYEAGAFERMSSQATPTRNRRSRPRLPEEETGNGRHRGPDEQRQHGEVARAPKPPATLVFYDDWNDEMPCEAPEPVYGQYPRRFIAKILPWLDCTREKLLHVCSGSLPRGEGIRVDIRPEARPDVLADATNLPFADGSIVAALADPPYSPRYARGLYKSTTHPNGIKYARPAWVLRELCRVVRPGGRFAIVHYITPRPPPGATFIKARGMSTGFDMPIRAVTIFQKDGAQRELGV